MGFFDKFKKSENKDELNNSISGSNNLQFKIIQNAYH